MLLRSRTCRRDGRNTVRVCKHYGRRQDKVTTMLGINSRREMDKKDGGEVSLDIVWRHKTIMAEDK